MSKKLTFFILLCLAVFVHSATAQPVIIADPPFSTPNVGSCPSFQFHPAGAIWVFSTDDAGSTTGGCGGNYHAPALPAGPTQAGFIQTGVDPVKKPDAGKVSKTMSGLDAGGNYSITFYATGRADGAGCCDNCTELNFCVLACQTDILASNLPFDGLAQPGSRRSGWFSRFLRFNLLIFTPYDGFVEPLRNA